MIMQHQITESHPLLNAEGNLNEPGYAKRLLPLYNKKHDLWSRMHTKEWDYYYVGGQHFAIALTIADNGYMGLDSFSFLNFDDRWEVTRSKAQVLTLGKKQLPASSTSGDIHSSGKGYSIEFLNRGIDRILNASMDNFSNGQKLEAHIKLAAIPDESMVICTPFDKPKHFYYNQKINTMRADGRVTLGSAIYPFTPDKCFSTLDWGRGIWTYSNTWYWSSLNSEIDGHAFGFNLGYGFGNTSAASENMLFYDGKAHKLDQVEFHIPSNGGKDDFMSPWTFTSNDNRVDLTFEPILDRSSLTDAWILKSDQNQVFGKFTGNCILDDGKVIHLDHLLGFAEKVLNKW